MFDSNQDIKRFYYIVETLKIHGAITYGTDDIDVDALMHFLKSPNMTARCWGCDNLDEIEEIVLQDILNGMPVWRFFHLPQWTQDILEREWEEICAEEEKRRQEQEEHDKRTYLCLQNCAHLDRHESAMGLFIKCKATGMGGDSFKYRKKCKHYCDKDTLSERDARMLRYSRMKVR